MMVKTCRIRILHMNHVCTYFIMSLMLCVTMYSQVAMWNFKNAEASVQGAAGGYAFAVKSPAWSDGIGGKALDAAKGAYVIISDATSLDLTGPMTVEAMVKRTTDATNGASGWVGIMSKGGYQKGYQLMYHQTSKRIAFCVNTDGKGYVLVFGKELVVDEWTHIAGVYDISANRLRVYQNGALAGDAAQNGRVTAFPKDVFIGKGGEFPCFNGSIQLVSLYDRAFSREEAAARDAELRGGDAKTDTSVRGAVTTISLETAANMGLVDDVSGDQKGGWTDQGRGNDLAALSPGEKKYANVPFLITAADKACIMLRGAKRPYFPESVILPTADTKARFIYLMHATAYTPGGSVEIGRIVPVYTDGEGAPVSVVRGRDVADWWHANTIENGYLGFSTENGSSQVGLYVSKFQIDGARTLKGIRFESANNAVWGIVGVTLSGTEFASPKKTAYTITESKEWTAIKIEKMAVPGSALDFSGLVDAPAGKYGFLTTSKDGRFVFEKGTAASARFAGTHIATFNGDFLTPMSHDEITMLAQNVARMGYNSARFQYVDNIFLNDREDPSSINTANLDAFDFLLAELKKYGVYATIDLSWARGPKKLLARHFPGYTANWRDVYTPAFYVVAELRDELKSHAKDLLEHKNPYTGLSWKDDPAFLYIDMVNEDPIELFYGRVKEVHAVYEREFNNYLKKRYRSTQELISAWGKLSQSELLEQGTVQLPKSIESDKRSADVCRFLSDLQIEGYKEMSAYLRGIGVKQPISACNMVGSRFTAFVRRTFDLADQHGYWDHPKSLQKAWDLPYGFRNTSAISRLQWPLGYLGDKSLGAFFATSRIVGKPFIVSEYNFVLPNMYRSEAGLYMGMVAALQGWDGLWHMGYAVSRDDVFSNNIMKGFMSASDPVEQAFERQIKLLYLRGDAAEAPDAVRLFSKPEDLYERWDLGAEAAVLSFITRVGLDVGDSPTPGGAVMPLRRDVNYTYPNIVPYPASNEPSVTEQWLIGLKGTAIPAKNKSDLSKGLIETATREARFNFTEGTMAVNTAGTKGWAIKQKGRYELPGLAADIDAGVCSLSFSSLDIKPLAESTRVIIIFPTDAVNNNMKFESDDRTVLTSWGETPVLMRTGTASVTLKNPNRLKLFALATSGRRIAEIPVNYTDDRMSFTLSHAQRGTAVLYWELAGK